MPAVIPEAVLRAEAQADAWLREQSAPQPQPTPVVQAQPEPPAPAPTPVVAPAVETPPQEPKTDWKAKFLVLQGKYNAEVPRYAADLREVKAENASLRSEIERLRGELANASRAPAPPAVDESHFDQDLVALINTRSTAAATAAMASVQGELAQVRQRAETAEAAAAQAARARFESAFNGELQRLGVCNHYAEIEAEDGFVDFASSVDPMSGSTRQELIESAIRAGDHNRLARIYKAYHDASGRGTPAAPAPTPAAPAFMQATIVPPSGGVAPNVPPAVVTYSMSRQLTPFYNDTAKGRWRGREQEWARINAEFDAAIASGRVTP